MRYEVEQKFPVLDRDAWRAKVDEWGLVWAPAVEQTDSYFNHPARDFATTDEALRIRTVAGQSWVTYKGPKLDAHTKTRREVELPLGAGAETGPALSEVLTSLGFRPTAQVVKRRQAAHRRHHNRDFEILFDDVAELGLYVEIETLAEEQELPAARAALLALAAELGLTQSERRSYLELLLESRSCSPAPI